MSLLDDLGAGLRGAGGVMDQNVYNNQRREDNLLQQLQEERKRVQAQLIVRAAETGAVDPQVAQAQLKQLGIDAPVGPDAHTQQRQEEIKRRNDIAKAMGGLTPEDRQNPLKIADVFLTNGDHATGLKYVEMSQQDATRKEAVLARIAQAEAEMRQKSEDKALDREQRAEAAKQANDLKEIMVRGQQALQRESLELRRVMAANRPEPQKQVVQTDQGPVTLDRAGNASPIMVNGQRAGPAKSTTDHLTEGEAKGTLFYRQMKSANDEIDKIGLDVSKIGNQIGARLATHDLTNWLAPKEAQQYAQATEQWAEAYLRLKTGAATNSGEIKRNARTYFPQPGDSSDVIDQKNRMRRQAESDVAVVAGRGLKMTGQTPGASGGWSAKVKGE